MNTRRRRITLRMLLVTVLAAGTIGAVDTTPAFAAPTNCSHGASFRAIGMWIAWYGWAKCTSGSGKVQVAMVCPEVAGGSTYVVGPDVNVPGESKAVCPDARKPVLVVASLTS
jgi:hypothetical protein